MLPDLIPVEHEIKAFAQEAKGPLILYISDTDTRQYPQLAQLLGWVRPGAIIHTGDSADEWKVGRKPEHREGYEAGLKVLGEILKGADCPVYFTSGNNDDFTTLPEEFHIIPNKGVVEVLGLRCYLTHMPPLTKIGDVDFVLYGHSGNWDPHYPFQPDQKPPIYLNGMFHWALIDSATKEFLVIPSRPPLKMKHYLTQTHLHAGFENFASIRSHAMEAKEAGYDALFITEHDVRMNRMKGCIEEFRLQTAGAAGEQGTGWFDGEGEPGESVPYQEGFALKLVPGKGYSFQSAGKKHQASLLAELTVTLELDLPEDTAACIDFTLSQKPKGFEQQHLCYCLGGAKGYDWQKTIEWNREGRYEFPLSKDVLEFDPEFGQDNAFLSVTVTTDTEGYLKGLFTQREYVAEDVRKRQRLLAKKISEAFGIAVFSGYEKTPGHHMNCYSEKVPVVNYEEEGYETAKERGTAHLAEQGAVFSYNHPFQEWGKIPDCDHGQVINELIQKALETRLNGAQLMEVGFPRGRYGFSLEEHLYLWDQLGMKGLKLTGVGDSDSHDSKVGWRKGNNFGNWLRMKLPRAQYAEAALLAGRVCMGNPYRWKADWEFSVNGREIGQTLRMGEADTATARICFKGLAEPVRLRVMSGGEELYAAPIEDGRILELPVRRGKLHCCPVRLEVYAEEDGRCLFLTNPVYLED